MGRVAMNRVVPLMQSLSENEVLRTVNSSNNDALTSCSPSYLLVYTYRFTSTLRSYTIYLSSSTPSPAPHPPLTYSNELPERNGAERCTILACRAGDTEAESSLRARRAWRRSGSCSRLVLGREFG